MCERPCWGTPEEIKKIIEAGFSHKLMVDWWENSFSGNLYLLCGAIIGHEKSYAPYTPFGRCAFLTDDNLCEIHNLKPSEGKFSDCSNSDKFDWKEFRYQLAIEWQSKEGKNVLTDWKKSVGLLKGD